jgi:hypothetical protein
VDEVCSCLCLKGSLEIMIQLFFFSCLALFVLALQKWNVWSYQGQGLSEIFILRWSCIIYKFALFHFQPDTHIILYIYNLGFLSVSTCFGPIGPSSGDQMLFIAQAASGIVPSVVVCLARPLVLSNTNGRARQTTGTVPEAACAIKSIW